MTFEQEVKSSRVFAAYMVLQKLTKYIRPFKWAAAISFLIGAADMLINGGEVTLFTKAVSLLVWIPGITFAFVAGAVHMAVGHKMRELSKKYFIDIRLMPEKVANILNS